MADNKLRASSRHVHLPPRWCRPWRGWLGAPPHQRAIAGDEPLTFVRIHRHEASLANGHWSTIRSTIIDAFWAPGSPLPWTHLFWISRMHLCRCESAGPGVGKESRRVQKSGDQGVRTTGPHRSGVARAVPGNPGWCGRWVSDMRLFVWWVG